MNLLEKERQNPYHFEKPLWPQFEWKGAKEFELYFILTKDERINGLYFQGPSSSYWFPYFGLLCKMAEKQFLCDLLFLSWADFYDLMENDTDFVSAYENGDLPLIHYPILLLKQAIDAYRGVFVKEIKSDDLLCSCFGVTYENLKNFLEQENEKVITPLDVTKELMVAGGCRSCLSDLEDYLLENGLKSKIVDFLLELPELAPYLTMNVLSYKGLIGRQVSFKCSNPEKFKEIKDQLQKKVMERFHIQLEFFFEALF